MDYQALYRKYRPQRFDEVIGQDHVVRTLAREVVDGKVAHAYLFAGPRGTGKTTSARLLAKAMNCTNRQPDGEPDNECASCIGIAQGTSLDVIELDAASHNKVDDVREIRVNVGTVAASGGAHRIYILDEAHMLSRAAGNALLKTLEEPPEHVIFVLATTEPYKLLDTIRSRSQRFDFHPVSTETLMDYLGIIAKREEFTVSDEAMAMVATHAKGSVRDAMSLLEQVAALGGGKVEASSVARALGLADRDAFGTLANAIAKQDAPAALGLIASLASQGADLRRFVADAVGFFRGVFLAQYAPNLDEVADESGDTLDEWRRYATELASADVLRAVDHLGEALLELRQGREERLVVELALLKLARPETANDNDSLDARLRRLEDRVRNLASAPTSASAQAETPVAATAPPAPKAAPVRKVEPEKPDAPFADAPAANAPASSEKPESASESAPDPEPAPPPATLPPADISLDKVEAIWPALVARVREEAGPRRHALLKEAQPAEAANGTIVFEIPDHLGFHLEQLKHDEDLGKRVVAIATEMLGGSIKIDFRAGGGPAGAAPAAHLEAVDSKTPDKGDLLEEGEGGSDPADLVADILGGEVVSD